MYLDDTSFVCVQIGIQVSKLESPIDMPKKDQRGLQSMLNFTTSAPPSTTPEKQKSNAARPQQSNK